MLLLLLLFIASSIQTESRDTVTFVTGLVQMSKAKRPHTTYYEWASNAFAALAHVRTVCFCEPSSVCDELRRRVAVLNASRRVELRAAGAPATWRAHDYAAQHAFDEVRDPAQRHGHSRALYRVWTQKAAWLRAVAAESDDARAAFYWVDIGYFRAPDALARLAGDAPWPAAARVAAHARVVMLLVERALPPPASLDAYRFVRHSVAAGFYGGRRAHVLAVCDAFFRALNDAAARGSFIGNDQTVMAVVAASRAAAAHIELFTARSVDDYFSLPAIFAADVDERAVAKQIAAPRTWLHDVAAEDETEDKRPPPPSPPAFNCDLLITVTDCQDALAAAEHWRATARETRLCVGDVDDYRWRVVLVLQSPLVFVDVDALWRELRGAPRLDALYGGAFNGHLLQPPPPATTAALGVSTRAAAAYVGAPGLLLGNALRAAHWPPPVNHSALRDHRVHVPSMRSVRVDSAAWAALLCPRATVVRVDSLARLAACARLRGDRDAPSPSPSPLPPDADDVRRLAPAVAAFAAAVTRRVTAAAPHRARWLALDVDGARRYAFAEHKQTRAPPWVFELVFVVEYAAAAATAAPLLRVAAYYDANVTCDAAPLTLLTRAAAWLLGADERARFYVGAPLRPLHWLGLADANKGRRETRARAATLQINVPTVALCSQHRVWLRIVAAAADDSVRVRTFYKFQRTDAPFDVFLLEGEPLPSRFLQLSDDA